MRAGSEGSHSQKRLVTASRQLLDAVIFHRAHVEGLAAIASSYTGGKGPDSTKEWEVMEQSGDDDMPEGNKGHSQAPTYLSLLFKVAFDAAAHLLHALHLYCEAALSPHFLALALL